MAITLAILSACLLGLLQPQSASLLAADTFADPFTCDPYRFPCDFPLKCNSPYTSIQHSMLVNSASQLDQTISISIWSNYTTEANPADASWFTFSSTTSPLPAGGVAAFNMTCTPPLCSLADGTYRTYLKVHTSMSDGYQWERPLAITVRIGSAVPIVDYTLGQGFRIASITGDEGTSYTQDQITILVNNRSTTPNEFCLSPMEPNPPTSPIEPDAAGDFLTFQQLWRDDTATNVYADPKPNTKNPDTGKYDEYALYTLDTDNNKVPFGTFLGASYDRKADSDPVRAYPYRINGNKSADIPFTLRVNSGIPTAVYRLQILVSPCGISTSGTDSTSIGIQYACKIPVQVTRTTPPRFAHSTASNIGLIILVAVGGGLTLYLSGLWIFHRIRSRSSRKRQRRPQANYSTDTTTKPVREGR
jgi:hypothetical protein